jgi:predicted NAD-dependent protein-ADP-ribosyltransferase YbiA (DUF1768 family)
VVPSTRFAPSSPEDASPSLGTNKEIVFVFSDKSTDKTLPGKGPGEKIPKSNVSEFKDLAEIPDWRKKLDTTWPAEIELDGKTWTSVEHYVQATKYRTNPAIYDQFSKESGSELSTDPEMAKSVGETGKFKGKLFKFAGVKKMEADPAFSLEETTYFGNLKKFKTHPDLLDVLRKTRSAELRHNLRGKEPELQTQLMNVRQRLST